LNKIFLLGAKDPEMDMIESILIEHQLNYTYAEADNRRCHPGNSYRAENILDDYDKVIYIESGTIKNYENTVSLDHHHEGDFGYDKKYHLFLEASSIGQLIKYLIDNELYNVESVDYWMTYCIYGFMYLTDNGWFYRKSKNEFIPISKKIVLVAAADHSLSEAYKGICPGVEKFDLIEERYLEIASAFNNDIELVKNTMLKYMSIFSIHSQEILDLRYLDLGTGYSVDYLCLRELAISNDQPVLVKTKDSEDSSERVMFLSLSFDQATDILKNKSFLDFKLDRIFGVPVRGYVGGFIKR